MVKKYQDPKEADKLMKIESELDEIQGMLTKTMGDLLDRGEKLDDLMKDSEYINNTAFNFY
jgi:synaptobrevin family protein YKT6